MKEWWTPAELATLNLPDLQEKHASISDFAKKNWRDPAMEYPKNPNGLWRKRNKVGGGYEYRYDLLPEAARAKLTFLESRKMAPEKPPVNDEDAGELWSWFEGKTDTKKNKARQKLEALHAVRNLELSGCNTTTAIEMIAVKMGVDRKTLFNWKKRVAGLSPAHWLPALAPRHLGRTTEAECTPIAWDVLRTDYLRGDSADFAACYRRLKELAEKEGWIIPSQATLWRRIEAIPLIIRVLAREGIEAAARMFPAQIRDKTVFHAGEAACADGHKWDVMVRWPDGETGRPIMVGFSDIYSNKLLSWRFTKTENKETVLLAIGDMIENYGIPNDVYLDNGRAFASKWISGGAPNRYRFKIKETDPQGVLVTLGINVHWATPYHGQSKPIERSWRDFATEYAKHPAFAGAYTGNSPSNKPHTYGKRIVPFEDFKKVIDSGIAEWNARQGRKTQVCGGKFSFNEVFEASYSQHPVLKATPEQTRMWLLAAQGVKVRTNALVVLMGNTYHADFLIDMIGEHVVLRFDIDDLHAGVHVYRLDGAYAGEARCIEATGFNDADAAREHARDKNSWMRTQKELLALETKLGIDEVAAMQPVYTEPSRPKAKVIRHPAFKEVKTRDEDWSDDFGKGMEAISSGSVIAYKKKSGTA